MSTTKTKEELVRLSWLTELRRQGHRQCKWDLHASNGGACALGILAEVAGLTPDDTKDLIAEERGFEPIGELAGLACAQTNEVWKLNDGSFGRHKHTFAEIADVVAGWFPS